MIKTQLEAVTAWNRGITMDKKDNISSTLYVCKICGRRVPKGDPMFACCEDQQVCGNCYLKEEDRKERD